MILSIKKLSYLWKTKSKTFTENRELCERVDSVYKIVGEWEANRDVINELRLLRSPEDEDIPTDNWKKVEKKLLVAYDDNEQLKFHRSHVKEVEDLLHIVDRRQNFRISSNADSGSSYETVTTTVGCEILSLTMRHIITRSKLFSFFYVLSRASSILRR